MSETNCPKCGAGILSIRTDGLVRFGCTSILDESNGAFNQAIPCLITELRAENEKLRAELEIPAKELQIANFPIDSPYWYSSSGEEYENMSDAHWYVINVNLGPYRLRHICKIMKSIKIVPATLESMP